jgi:hypothetical protein
MNTSHLLAQFEHGAGILQLLPTWVTMNFNQAGGRLRLHPDDWFPKGVKAGSVKERWFSSVLSPRSGSSEGLSFIRLNDNERTSLPEAIDVLGADLIGPAYQEKYGTWPIHAKFFDYFQPLFFHLHLDDASAARIGVNGKPEAYYFPVQLNNHPGALPATYFGFAPGVSQDEVRTRLQNWEQRDAHILELSRAYQLELGTGWYTPPGALHAPGSYLTYEVQWNSASGAVFENVTSDGETFGLDMLNHAVPPERQGDWDTILNLINWPINLDPLYREHYFRPPLALDTGAAPYSEKWIVYGNPYFSAKELSVAPGHSVMVKDERAYGCVVIQGHGQIGAYDCEVPGLLRYDQPSADEFFVGEIAAKAGVQITNRSPIEPLVLLKHFGPGVPDAPGGE